MRLAMVSLFAVTRGDLDEDDEVDLLDFVAFERCFTGDGIIQEDRSCTAAHFDPDGDIDGDDVAGFATAMTGPG